MKIHLSFLWIVMLAAAFFSHALKTFLILFALLLIHEMAHVAAARVLRYETGSLHIYPFGYSCEIAHLPHGKSIEEIFIVLAGLCMHLCFPLLFQAAYQWDLISLAYLSYLNELNHAVFVFNCLPIYPLDGGRMLDALLHFFLPYDKARKITLLFSFLLLSLFVLLRIFRFPNMLLIILFLYYQQYSLYKSLTEDQLQFYYYRFKHPLSSQKRKKKTAFYRNFPIMKIEGRHMVQEEMWLKQLFSKSK